MTKSPDNFELYRSLLEELASKWTLVVLGSLCEGPLRFNALRRANTAVTQKALTQCLRRLELAGLINRTVETHAVISVTYSITPLGRSLEPHLLGLMSWAETNRSEILHAKQRAQTSQP